MLLLKRLHDQEAKKRGEVKVSGVIVMGYGGEHHFTPKLVEMGVAENWLTMGNGQITVVGKNKSASFKIVRTPGYYCSHCKAPMPDGSAAAAHVKTKHAGVKSPDRNNPSGYGKQNYFETVAI